MGRDLDFALELADLADSISAPRFRARDLAVDTKPDLSPVTDADRAVERALRERIGATRPGEPVFGEEEGGAVDGPVRWIVDPIDGTKNFSRGIPIWGTLIALERDGEVVLGVASAPGLRRRWWAERGAGAFADGQPIRVSGVGRMEDAVFSFTRTSVFSERAPALDLVRRAWHARTFSDCWQHLLVAEGSVDAAIDDVMNPWDIAALRVIVEEAGGRSTDFGGGRALDGGSLVSSNGVLHDEVLAALTARGQAPGHGRASRAPRV
ncbi:MAG: histidinol-phosphatase [Actinomycetota bacterium]|nr:histidinol-phosphatase [Actinomycetota bacterium]